MDVVDARIERILTAAAQAPSVHNTQPWTVQVQGNRIAVHADPSRQLRHVDPTGREMYISCGAFLFNLRVAARRESLKAVVAVLPSPSDDLLVGRVRLEPDAGPHTDELELSVAVGRRATSRAQFDDQPLDLDVLREMQEAARDEEADLRAINPSDPVRTQVLELVRRAEALAAEDAIARSEESTWTATDPNREDGIPADLLGPATSDDEAPVRHFWGSTGSGGAAFEHRSTMAVLSTSGDSRQDWVAAGQGLEHLLLVATTYFVHASFATTVLENPTTRHDLRRALDLAGHPQMLMRLGYSRTPPHTPRRTVEEIITSKRPEVPGT
ncbi:Nitroreductase family protein [Sanguibacter gelidistatuariae]|uniref:Nitroreductase family protein n=1 Tax=Sanguibacter gelidistatuariae TaxID=1814289 RepID=A0A1G6K1N4_9MICO|nr:nitroreductase family protein [Sanguibacter gelidistatuariae]SDC24942.1 Nitroreductase family protein [Sanguibacter gelidistatuariae]